MNRFLSSCRVLFMMLPSLTEFFSWIATAAVVIGWAVSWGKTNQRITNMELKALETDTDQRDVTEKLGQLKESLDKFMVALVGLSGDNGFRGELREVKAMVNDVSERLRTLEARHTDE